MPEVKEEKKSEKIDWVTKIEGYWTSYRDNVLEKYRPKWLEFYQKYSNYVDPNDQAHENNTFIPRCYENVETVVPRISLAYFSVKPPVQAAPRSSDDIQQAETITDVLAYFNERLNYFDYVNKLVKMASIYGISIAKSAWDKKNNMPIRYIVHPQDFFIDPTATTLEEASYCGDRKIRPLSYLRRMEAKGLYENINEVVAKKQVYSPSSELLTDQKSVHDLQNPHSIGTDKDDPSYEVVEAYVDWGKRLVTICGGVEIRNEVNPFIHDMSKFEAGTHYPYAPVFLTQDVVEFYGIGTIEPIRYVQDDINDLHRGQSDYIARSINGIVLTAASEWETSGSWKWKQGNKWKMNDINGAKILDMKPLAPESWAMGTRLDGIVDRTNAMSDYVTGAGGSNESATGAALLARAADNRLKLQLFNVQNCLNRLMSFDIKNIQAFMPEEMIIRVTGKPFIKVKRSDIQAEVDVFAAGVSDLTTKEMKRSQLMNLVTITMTSGIPQLMLTEGKKVNMTEIYRQILETFEFKNMDSIISDIPMGDMGGSIPIGGQPPARQPNIGEVQDLLKPEAESTSPLQMVPIGG